IGEATAEHIKVEMGTAQVPEDGIGLIRKVRGRDLVKGMPSEVEVNQTEIAHALAELTAQIV
ncbi:rod shape-determining protein, partial [Serratia marcescens]